MGGLGYAIYALTKKKETTTPDDKKTPDPKDKDYIEEPTQFWFTNSLDKMSITFSGTRGSTSAMATIQPFTFTQMAPEGSNFCNWSIYGSSIPPRWNPDFGGLNVFSRDITPESSFVGSTVEGRHPIFSLIKTSKIGEIATHFDARIDNEPEAVWGFCAKDAATPGTVKLTQPFTFQYVLEKPLV
jgi:hypothetical protein